MKRWLLLLLAAALAVPALAQESPSVRYQGELNIGYGAKGSLYTRGEPVWANLSRFFLETIHGARITPYAYVGAGAGLAVLYDDSQAVLPVFADVRGYWPVGEKFEPYVVADLGYGVGFDRLPGGFYGSFGAGFRALRKVNFALGYQRMHVGEVRFGSFFYKIGWTF